MLKALRSPDGADEEIRSSICDPYFERPFRVATVYHPDGRRCDYLIDRGSSMAHETMVPVSGNSLPMYLALGSRVRCGSIFTRTSPLEIYEASGIDRYFYVHR
jgi:hypothetical protein